MPAINFQEEFASKVRSGLKRTTIRLERKRPIKAGDNLVLYAGQRTPGCVKLKEAKCLSVKPIEIDGDDMAVDGIILDEKERGDLAHGDGFGSEDAFVWFFRNRYGLPFKGGELYTLLARAFFSTKPDFFNYLLD